ncbi:hypothetical protein ABFS82_14G229100 [Erythranthe guttata]|uniref:Aluminum-activated malate transporter n=1 Tax=Erythranthe guttata TaxID=4155 RepID=A0A022R723_ERYGU|nr:hypothetical protein MIMGU_mgv1a006083mg [Erythranthe guttata]
MQIESENLDKKVGFFLSGWLWIKGLIEKFFAKLREIAKQIEKTAKDDPRRLIHSLKVGVALTLVSLFYYCQPLYRSFGVSSMWAVMTVVVVFEFSVGATLGKGLNRGMATLVAGGLGIGAHYLAMVAGKTCEPILIGLFVFLQAVASTFIRFFPKVKARYDYGMLIFILTFCLVAISGLRSDEIIEIARKRVLTILVGALTCVVVSVFIYPVWAGEDLHLLVAQHLDKLGHFLEGFGERCLRTIEESDNLVGLNTVLDSKSREEILANFARWEPGHGKFMYRHPWKQYLKIASLTRQCASRVDSLNAYLNSKSHAPKEIQGIISSMSRESGKALRELSLAVETMTRPSPYPNCHVSSLKAASKNLNSLLKSELWGEHANLLQVIPVAAVASLLDDTVTSVEKIADAVDELSSLANFGNAIGGETTEDKSRNGVVTLVGIVIEGSDQVKKGQSSGLQAG